MSGARDAILARLRAAPGTPEGRAAQIEAWLREPRGGPLPALPPDPIETFVARAQTAAAQVRRVNGGTETVAALREILALGAGPSVLAAAPDEHIQALPWPADLQVEHRNAGPADRVCLSAAYAGIAETGSLVLLSGPLTPTSMAFLPDHFVCLLRAEHIVPHPEDVWARLGTETGVLPRGVHLITGPSRTADVEQTMQLGAHGPRQLTILLSAG